MPNVIEIEGRKINIGTNPANYRGFEDEVIELLAKLDQVNNEAEHNILLGRLIKLKRKRVLFPSCLMLSVARNNKYRPPSYETLCKIPGFETLHDNIKVHWPKLVKNSMVHRIFERIAISLYMCMEIKSLLDITPDLFACAMRSWKEKNGFWNRTFFTSEIHAYVPNKVAEAYNRINSVSVYRLATQQPRTKDGLVFSGAAFKIAHPNAATKKWVDYFDEWLQGLLLSNTKHPISAFGYFLKWLERYSEDLTCEPEKFLLITRNQPSFVGYMRNGEQKLAKAAAKHVMQMCKFTDWIRATYLIDTSEDGTVVLGQPILLPNEEREVDGAWAQNAPSETQSRPLPTAWRLKVRDIIKRNNFEFPKSINAQYFQWMNPVTKMFESIWVPSIAYAFLVMLEIPLRMIQVIALDSGEGDEKRYNPDKKEWVTNDHRCANYWANDPNAKTKNRGVIKAKGTPISPIVGFYINTNKTAGNSERYGEFAGYDIPWQNEEIIALLSELRTWQEKYNPVDKPLPFAAVAKPVFGYVATREVLKKAPDRFYLFRTPTSPGNPLAPPTYRQRHDFWVELMEKLESELREEGEDVTIILKWKADGHPQTPFYNIHGLRVATLTAFAEAGVPIEVLSKLVAGHSTILMTLYYLKFNEAAISSLLTEKALAIAENAESDLRRCLENKAWEDAKRVAVYNDENTFRRTIEEHMYPSWLNIGFGFCPNAGTRCHEGGAPVKNGANENDRIYGPVSGGAKNCIRCRFLLSGTPFLLRLWLKTNKCLADAKKIAKEYDGLEQELQELVEAKYRLAKENRKEKITGKMRARIKELEATAETRADKLNDTFMDLHAAWRLLEKIKWIIDAEGAEKETNQLSLTVGCTEAIEPTFREGSRFELTSYLLKASRVVPFLQDEDMEREREKFLDVIMYRENLIPLSLLPLTDRQKLVGADAASMWLLSVIGAREVEALHEGKNSLKALGLVNGEIITAIESGIGKKLPSSVAPLTRLPEIEWNFIHG